MSCKKGFSNCDRWNGHMSDCPGCDEVNKIPRAECSVCHFGLKVEMSIVDGRYLDIKVQCPNHGYIKYKGQKQGK